MKRIIGMLMAVCFCFGLCMQTNVSEAARWKTIFTDHLKVQWQIDMDSIQCTGNEMYRVWVRWSDQEMNPILYEYKVEKETTLMYYGLYRTLGSVRNGKVERWNGGKFLPVYPDAAYEGSEHVLAYLNQNFGDKSVKVPNWTWFYSSDTTTYKIDVNTISKVNGIYNAWVLGMHPRTSENENFDYLENRMQYKKDKHGRLWVRSQREISHIDNWEKNEKWRLAEGSEMYPIAEKEFAFIKSYLGEK